MTTTRNLRTISLLVLFSSCVTVAIGQEATSTSPVVDRMALRYTARKPRSHCRIQNIKSKPIVFADFESGTYTGWTLEGNCWGKGPVSYDFYAGLLSGWNGEYYVCTYQPSGRVTGKATSRTFRIEQGTITFLIGGGYHPETCSLNLVVDGKVVRTAFGNNRRVLERRRWDVSDLIGQDGHIEIIDNETSDRMGYLMVDDIVFTDSGKNPLRTHEADPPGQASGTADTSPQPLPPAVAPPTGIPSLLTDVPAHPTPGQKVALKALALRGCRYHWGGTSVATGFDCSGLVQTVFRQCGVRLPRLASEQFHVGKPVAYEELQPGDLVFFQNTYKPGISHVGIYIGDNCFVNAGDANSGVMLSGIGPQNSAHWAGARRIDLNPPVLHKPAHARQRKKRHAR